MENAVAVVESSNPMLMPVANLSVIKQVYQAKKEFIGSILKSGVDFGTIPGSDKPALLKPGAEKMSSFFNLSPSFEDIEKVEDWTGEQHGNEPFFYYRIRCHMFNGDRRIASADGSCNSWEKKYRYRQGTRVCPTCGQPTIFKSKDRPEWYCWAKKGGCGAKFQLTDKAITDQEVGLTKNPDVAELVNTILKMAQKRALVAVTLIATGTSEYFTQDIDDFVDASFVPEPTPETQPEHEPEITKPATNHVQAPMSAKMSHEMAETMADSKGKLFKDMTKAELAFHANEYEKRKKDNGLTQEQRDENLMKLDAAKFYMATPTA